MVLLGVWRGSRVAVKKLFGVARMDRGVFVREAKAHSSLRHPVSGGGGGLFGRNGCLFLVFLM